MGEKGIGSSGSTGTIGGISADSLVRVPPLGGESQLAGAEDAPPPPPPDPGPSTGEIVEDVVETVLDPLGVRHIFD